MVKEDGQDSQAVNPKERMAEMEKKLLVMAKAKKKKKSFEPNHCVEILHDDCSRMMFHSAFTIKEGDWYYIFTEHHGNMFYNKSDVWDVIEYKRVNREG